jgi:hypothetical protein
MAPKRRREQTSDEEESEEQETTKKREVKAKGKPGRKPKNQQVKQESESEIEEENVDGSEEEDSFEKIDPRFKQSKQVVVYITLPSGQEEVIIDYVMNFSDKNAYTVFKENGGQEPDATQDQNTDWIAK